jgi:C_GCAxxG_C_C family probable redox protein
MSKQKAISDALKFFDDGYACSQSVLLAFSDEFNLDERTAKLISANFGGGMGRLREKCGALTGGFMVLGLKYGNTDPKDLDTKLASYKKVRILNKQMLNDYGSADCSDILKKTCNKSGSSRPKTSQDHLSRDCW